jgi:hypothetical protein
MTGPLKINNLLGPQVMGRKSKKRKRYGQCVYCGALGPITDDHVFPQCLFDGPLPPNMPVVPACEKCNKLHKSRNDSFLRDVLARDLAAMCNPVAQRLIKGPIKRSIERNQSEFVRSIPSVLPIRPLYDSDGRFLEFANVVPVDNKRVVEIFTVIAKGLYYHTFNALLPSYITIQPRRLELKEIVDKILPLAEQGGPLNRRGDRLIKLGESVTYGYVLGKQPYFHVSFWIVTFFESIFVALILLEPIIKIKAYDGTGTSIHEQHGVAKEPRG